MATVRWPRSVFADTLEELAHEAELHFRPGTTYSIYSIREEGGGEDRVTYRADAHRRQVPGAAQTSSGTRATTEDGRTRVGRNLGHDAGPRPGSDGRRTPGGDGGGARGRDNGEDSGAVRDAATQPISGRIAEPGTGPAGGRPTAQPGGTVGGFNPETVTQVPGWAPAAIPTQALQTGPGFQAAYGLLMDGSAPGAGTGVGGPSGGLSGEPTGSPSAPEVERRGGPAGVVPLFSTADPELHEMLEHASPMGEDPDAPLDASGRRRTRLVFAGLLDDAVEAAERSGHHRWSAAGVLNGGRPGASVVCYGLGDGSDVGQLAQGLHRYAPMHLVLAVDPSRKHADTQTWVGQVAAVVAPVSVVAVPRTVTGTPGTIRDLGYRLHTRGDVTEILRR